MGLRLAAVPLVPAMSGAEQPLHQSFIHGVRAKVTYVVARRHHAIWRLSLVR